MSAKMYIHQRELERLMELCAKFNTETILIVEKDGGGIGKVMYADITTEVHGVKGTFRTEITGVEQW